MCRNVANDRQTKPNAREPVNLSDSYPLRLATGAHFAYEFTFQRRTPRCTAAFFPDSSIGRAADC